MRLKTQIASCHTANSKPVKQEVKGTVILPPLVFSAQSFHNFNLFYHGIMGIEKIDNYDQRFPNFFWLDGGWRNVQVP